VWQQMCKSPVDTEKRLHDTFKTQRCRGEWFEIDRDDVQLREMLSKLV